MVSLNNVSFGYGGQAILDGASFTFTEGCKIGLIGPNGAGKSTIFKLITKNLLPDQGSISIGKSVKIEYFHQDLLSLETTESIQSIVLQGFKEILEVQEKIDQLLLDLEKDYSNEKITKLGSLQTQFENMGGYSIQSKSEEILMGLGFRTEDLSRPLSEFSGGWRMRVLLGKILLAEPDLLLLDEPSNHLDLPSIEWLESYLSDFPGAFILISHDKRFLNSSVKEILEIRGNKLKNYKGNFDAYVEEKSLQDEITENAFKNQQKMIKDSERFINRFRSKASKARQVQSRIKQLEKIDQIQLPDESIREMNLKFPIRKTPGKLIYEADSLSKNYGDQKIFQKTPLMVKRGDKIALIGANGKGKSTLLRMISGRESFEGKLLPGYNVETEFFAQHQLEELNLNSSVLKEASDGLIGKSDKEVRDTLGNFLFSGEDVEKKVKVLSGGEKSRLALAKIFLSESNVLLLDEPTNHLDMVSIGVLRDALISYEGSFIVVSHDRDFVNGIANKIWWIEDDTIKEYLGPYEEYESWKNEQLKKDKGPSFEKKKEKKTKSQKQVNTTPSNEKEARKIEKEIDQLGTEIDGIEKKIIETSKNFDEAEFKVLKAEYDSLKSKQEELFKKWETLLH